MKKTKSYVIIRPLTKEDSIGMKLINYRVEEGRVYVKPKDLIKYNNLTESQEKLLKRYPEDLELFYPSKFLARDTILTRLKISFYKLKLEIVKKICTWYIKWKFKRLYKKVMKWR